MLHDCAFLSVDACASVVSMGFWLSVCASLAVSVTEIEGVFGPSLRVRVLRSLWGRSKTVQTSQIGARKSLYEAVP